MEIIQSKPSDASTLTAIAVASKKHWGYSDEQIEKWKPDLTVSEEEIQEGFTFHLEKSGNIFGFYRLSKEGEIFEIDHFWILPQYIRKGFGKLLFEHLRKTVLQNRGNLIRVKSDPNAQGFYLKMGMRHISEAESSIMGRTLPILEMSL